MVDGGLLVMSQKERNRKVLLESVKNGLLTLKEAGKRAGLGHRQMKRLKRRYLKNGDAGLVHLRRGQPSNRAFAAEFKKAVLARYCEVYLDFGPTFAAEKLLKDGLKLHHDTLRQWLLKEGLWSQHRKRKPYRQRRARKERFGELLQLDGSHHHWFGNERESSCLMSLIDDATGIRYALLAAQETTEAAMKVLLGWIERYGIPKAIYVDLKNVYISPHSRLTEEQQLAGFEETVSVFGKACEKLGILLIRAYSPQAKGRVERSHAVYQDRLVKEIKLNNLTKEEEVNHFLGAGFVDGLNQRFAVAPKDVCDAHRPAGGYDLNAIFSWEIERVLQQDWTIRVSNVWYQITPVQPLMVRPKYRLTVRRHLDGALTLWYKDKPLQYRVLGESEKQKMVEEKRESEVKPKLTAEERSLLGRKNARRSSWHTTNSALFLKRVINF